MNESDFINSVTSQFDLAKLTDPARQAQLTQKLQLCYRQRANVDDVVASVKLEYPELKDE